MRLERWPSIVMLRLRTLLRRADVERDLDDELRYHIDRQTEHNIAHGMSADDARRAALIAFGGMEQVKEATRDRLRSRPLAEVVQDLRYAGRVASRAPLVPVIALATVGVSIALATSAFSVLNSVLLRALPYRQSDRLALIWSTTRGSDALDPVSFTNAMDWRRDVHAFQSLATFSCTPKPILAARGVPARTTQMEVSSDFFTLLDGMASIGRLFDPRDFERGAAPSAVASYALWRDRLGADPHVLDSPVLIDGMPVRVIGVLRPDFAPPPAVLACRAELYRPLDSRYDDTQRSWSFLKAIGRLAPDATFTEAQSELDVENARLAAELPESNRARGARIVSLRGFVIAPLRRGLWLVQAGALLVLLIACANVAGVLLARASVRQREFSIRIALGASRSRLARQVVTEVMVLGIFAGLLGTSLAAVVSAVIGKAMADALPDPRGLAFDWRAIGFAVVVSLVATLVVGLSSVAAAVGHGRASLDGLRDGGGGRSTSSARVGLRRAVIVLQLALATIVLVAAGLLARSYRRLLDVHPGFDPTGVVTARVTLPDALYPRGERQVRFFQQVVDRLAARPRVVAVGAVSVLPESPNFDRTTAKVVGRDYAPGEAPEPDVYRVTPGYFDAMQIPLEAGRRFTAADDDRHPLVAIVNETMALALFPTERAVGKRIWSGAGQAVRTIVGVVGDSYQYGLDHPRTMQLYVPHADNSGGDLTIVVRASDAPRSVELEMKDVVESVDPGVPLDDVMTMDQVLAASAARRRLLAGLALAFAVGAIGLAAMGLYGVIAYSVSQRTPEIGLRMALGATAGAIVGRVLGDTGRLVTVGLAIGLVAAFWLTRPIAPLLFRVTWADPLAFVASAVLLWIVSLLAAAVPARRAATVNPAIALRGD